MAVDTPTRTPTGAGRDLTRRTVVVTVGAAAWSAPMIVTASAAPRSAVSGGAPAVAASDVTGVRRAAFGGTVDCGITFTNDGPVAASTLGVVVEFVVAVPDTSLTYGVNDVAAPWSSGPYEPTLGGFRVTFSRAGGLASGASDTLRFTINSASGTGQIIVSPPTTTPAGANTGSAGTWSDKAGVDMDITSISSPNDNGNIFVTYYNNGLVTATRPTVAVTITPTTGTFSFTSSGNTPPLYTVTPASIAATSSPATIEFTGLQPIDPGGSASFSFFIVETGHGGISATVTSPASPNNNTFVGSYL